MENVSVDTVEETQTCCAARENDRPEDEVETAAEQTRPDTSGDPGTSEDPPSDDTASAVQPEGGEHAPDDRDPLTRYRLRESNGAVVTRSGEPVCNFVIKSVCTMKLHRLNEDVVPYHKVHVQLADGTQAFWFVQGNLNTPANWTNASEDTASIIRPTEFRKYVFSRVDRGAVREDTAEPYRSEVVGTYRGPDKKLRVSRGLETTDKATASLYAKARFPESGSKDLFERAAALSTDGSVKALLVHALGTVFKPAFGDAYPHLKVEGARQSGKTTLVTELCPRFGFQSVDARAQFDTSYRRKLALSGTNLPLIADEIGRIQGSAARQLLHDLNLCYNSALSSHGQHGTVFRLMRPLVGVGHNWHITDEALLSKILVIHVDPNARDRDALRELRASDEVFPLGEWLEWACSFANCNDLLGMADAKTALLRARVPADLTETCAESDRCVWNYGTQLVVADALMEYGVNANVEDYIAAKLVEHLRLFLEDGRSAAERFVTDLLTVLARRTVPPEALCDVDEEGLFIHVESCLRALQRAGYTCDTSDPRVLSKGLAAQGIGATDRRRYFNRVRKRCVLITHERLEALGHRIDTGV